MPLTRLTQDEIKEMATAMVGNRLAVASALPEDLLTMIFMPLALGGFPDDVPAEEVGNIVEFMDRALPNGVNGYPIFMSCRIVHKEDWDQVWTRYERGVAAIVDG